MNRADALRLADKITRIWPRGAINVDTWTEVLEELDHYAPAEAAVRKLRDNSDTMPSIAALKGGYRAELGTHVEHVDCPVCGGDGWASTKPYVVNNHTYEGVTPCRCKAGEAVRDVHRRIIELNDAELRSHGRTPPEADIVPPPDWHTLRKDLT